MKKYQLVEYIMEKVYQKETRRVAQLLIDIHYNAGNSSFWYKGKRYGFAMGTADLLKPTFAPFMDAYLTQRDALLTECNYVRSYLTAATNNCKALGQLYVILPESLHSTLRELGIEIADIKPEEKPDIQLNEKGRQLLLTRLLLNSTET